MPSRRAPAAPTLDLSTVIKATPRRVLKAFFDPDALSLWWQVSRSVTTPRVLGPYVIEWRPAETRDPILGRLGGVFRGTVMQIDPARGFFLADAFWLPPDGDPVGPMALDVTCTAVQAQGAAEHDSIEIETLVRVRQTGFEESPRWRRYYEVAAVGWERALAALKTVLENEQTSASHSA
jgi:uncharacterized protein YndB with AHSA1/START domain